MYKANVYRVMIASPGDVPKEREIARELINEWNTLHSSHRNIVLIPLLWEYNTTPASGQRPQEIINDQLLQHADLLVGIFFTRIGSSTGKAISGTVEELETHVNNGKPAMLYFSNAAIPQGFDADQYVALQKFKSEVQQNNLYASYDSVEDFKEKFRRHLTKTINDSGFFLDYKDTIFLQNGINPTPASPLNFPDEAKVLLFATAKSADGKLMLSETKSGTAIQVGNKNYVPEQAPRIVAKWKGALEYLIGHGYIHPLSSTVYEITDLGYQYTDAETAPSPKAPVVVIEDLVVERSDSQFSAGICKYFTNRVTIKIINTGTEVIDDFSISVKMNRHLFAGDMQMESDGEYSILNFNEKKLYGGQSRSVKIPVRIIDRFVKNVIDTNLIVTVHTDKGNVSREYPIRSFFRMADVNQREVVLSEALFGNPFGV